MDELEQISRAAYAGVYGGDRIHHVGGAVCLRCDEAPDSPMLNRAVGLGEEREATEEDVEAVLDTMAGTTFYVAVSPATRRADSLAAMLEARGLERGWGWMLFRRPPEPPPPVTSTLRVVDVEASDVAAWTRIVVEGYGLPEAAGAVIGRAPELPNWHAFLALDGKQPVSAAAVFVAGDAAYFGFAATDPAHRGKGGQNALFATRVERALDLGARTLVTETGERRDDLPSNSYRNILRNGFVEDHVVAHRLRRRDA